MSRHECSAATADSGPCRGRVCHVVVAVALGPGKAHGAVSDQQCILGKSHKAGGLITLNRLDLAGSDRISGFLAGWRNDNNPTISVLLAQL